MRAPAACGVVGSDKVKEAKPNWKTIPGMLTVNRLEELAKLKGAEQTGREIK